MTDVQELRLNLREDDAPFFTEEELGLYLRKNNYNLRATTYECLKVKAQDTSLKVSGLDCADTSSYFLRLAQSYAPNHSGILK